jgi:hypothetical protein
MHMTPHRTLRCWIVTALVALAALPAVAQDAFLVARQRTGWVGKPLILQYTFTNVQQPTPPSMPQVDGLRFTLQPPTQQTQTNITFGRRRTQTTIVYPVAVTAERPGTYTIGAFDLQFDGGSVPMQPVTLVFRPSSDATLLRATVETVSPTSWLGDVVPALLEVHVRPFRHDALPSGKLSMMDTWRLLQQGSSNWGPFQGTVDRMRTQHTVPPTRTIANANGGVDWYIFQLPATLRPDRSGPIDMGDVVISMDYPVELGRSRNPLDDFMGRGGLRIVTSRPVTASAGESVVTVQTPPQAGRPDAWTGAVGRFTFEVQATPRTVDVGEPVTLRMTVTDTAQRPADLDTLAAPALHRIEELTDAFQVPEERPGGIVSGRSKTFTQSIRPINDTIELIPPIPFSFFNPETGRYETVFGPHIALSVNAGRTLQTADLPGIADGSDASDATLTKVQGGLLANITDPEVLLHRPQPPSNAWLLGVLAIPPLIFAGAAAGRGARRRHHRDPARQRARLAHRVAQRMFSDAGHRPEIAAECLRTLLQGRLDHPKGTTSAELVHQIRTLDPSLADDLLDVLHQLDAMTFGTRGGTLDGELQRRVEGLIHSVVEVTQ